MAGDVGFDPLGLSSIAGLAGADLYWMREAELKHGRIAMMAVAGVLWCETIGSLPGFPSGANQMKLFWEVWAEKPQYVAAGLIMCGIIESEFVVVSGVEPSENRVLEFEAKQARQEAFVGLCACCMQVL